MSETTVIETAELERLRERARKLAADKSYLELTLRLINSMSAVQGLDETVANMLHSVTEVIGGTNLVLYYYLDTALYRADVFSKASVIDAPHDELIERVLATRKVITVETPFSDTLLMGDRFSPAYTWAFPLVVGQDLIGAFKIEGLYIGMADFYNQLPSFFHHAALVLKSEIQNQNRLRKANEKLEAEVAVRAEVERKLRLANEALEQRVEQRTEDLQQERGLLSGIMETSPVGIAVVDAEGQFSFANIQAARLLRMDRDEIRRQRFGASVWSVTDASDIPVPEEELPFRRVLSTGDPIYDVQHTFSWPDGRRRLFSINAAPLTAGEDGIPRVILAIEDITHRKAFEKRLRRSNRELRAISDCNQTLMRAADEQTLLNDICRIICHQAGYRLAWVGYQQGDTEGTIRPVAWAAGEAESLAPLGPDAIETVLAQVGPVGIALQTGQALLVQDFLADERFEAWSQTASEKELRSGMALPLTDEGGRAFGELHVYASEPNTATPEELRLMHELAADLSFGIGVMRAREETRRTNELILSHAHFFESIDLINRAIQTTNNLEEMMARVLDMTLSILDCDRAFLAHPCEPGASVWTVRMERTAPGWPGLTSDGSATLPMTSDVSRLFADMLEAEGPVKQETNTDHPVPESHREGFSCQSVMALALYPKTGKPWALCLHQCDRPRLWTHEEERLFQEISRRLTDALSALLAHRRLAEGERRLRLSLEIGRIGAFEMDVGRGTGTYTPQVSALWGIPETYTGNLRELWQERLHPDDSASVLAAWSAMEKTSETQTELQFRIRHSDGTVRWALWWGQIVRAERGEHDRLVGVSMDITEKRKTEQELEQHRMHLEAMVEERTRDLALARDAAEAANRAKSRFLANISHELRTPLNAILGFTQIMSRDNSIPESARLNLAIVNRSGEHLLAMINDVLDLSKIEAGKVQVVEEPFNLVHLIEDVAEMLRSRATARGLHLIVDIPPDIQQHVQADMGKLRQALINLAGNAIKFTEHGGVAIRARTRLNGASPNRVTVEIEIEDTGPGIPADRIETLFSPFTQLETVRTTQKGTGLGLSISRSFLQMMGGDITVQSQEGQGSIFRMILPASVVAETAMAPVESSRVIIGLEPGQPEYRILIVEDSPENAALLQKLLKDVGFSVRTATNGLEGWQVAAEWRPHFIWMDMRMPVMDGYECTRKIRGETWGENIRIVAVTASAFTEQEDEIKAAGCDALLRKPYRQGQMFDLMARYLGVRYVATQAVEAMPAQAQKPIDPTREDFSRIGKDVVDRLKRAVIELDKGVILSLATSVEQSSPAVSGFLRHHVSSYNFEAIRKTLETST